MEDINNDLFQDDIKQSKWILYPTDTLKIIWNIIIGIFIAFSTIITPINLAFPDYRINNNSYSAFMYCIDAVFIFDILVNFVSVYEDKDRVGHYTFKEIFNNYI